MWSKESTRKKLGLSSSSDEPPEGKKAMYSNAVDSSCIFAIMGEGGDLRFGDFFQQWNVIPRHLNDAKTPGKVLLRPMYNPTKINKIEASVGVKFGDCPMLSKSGTLLQPSIKILEDDCGNHYVAPFALDRVLCSLRYFASQRQMCERYSYTVEGKRAIRYMLENLVSLHEAGYHFPYLSPDTIFVASSTQCYVETIADFRMVKYGIHGMIRNVKLESLLDLSQPHRLIFYFAFGFLVGDVMNKEDKQRQDWLEISNILKYLRESPYLELQFSELQHVETRVKKENEMTDLEQCIQAYSKSSRNEDMLKQLFRHPSLWTNTERCQYIVRAADQVYNSHYPTTFSELQISSNWTRDYNKLKLRLKGCLGSDITGINYNRPILDLMVLMRNVYSHFQQLDSYGKLIPRETDIRDLIFGPEPLLFVKIWKYMEQTFSLHF